MSGLGLLLEVGEEPVKWSDCFALENMSRARETPLLRRFFSLDGGFVSLLLRSEVDVLEALLPARFLSSVPVSLAGETLSDSVAGLESIAESSSLLALPNILFKRPPCVEKLLRLLPAGLMGSRARSQSTWVGV